MSGEPIVSVSPIGGDLRAFCAELKRKGVRMAVEPWEFKPGMVLCYVAAPDGVSIELIQVNR